MSTITIRNVPRVVRDRLAARAADAGLSLEEFLREELVELVAGDDPTAFEEWFATTRAHALTLPPITTAQILEALDADRR